jgi:hypothetical protein
MPFPEPETALPATIVGRGGDTLLSAELRVLRPGRTSSTTFQSLARKLNELEEIALSKCASIGLLSSSCHPEDRVLLRAEGSLHFVCIGAVINFTDPSLCSG